MIEDPADPSVPENCASSGPSPPSSLANASTVQNPAHPQGDAHPEDADPRAMLNRRFVAAMTVAAALVVANQFLVQPALLALATDAPVINAAGRQRMLSQRLAKAALAEAMFKAGDQRASGERTVRQDDLSRQDELETTLALWTRSHRGLRDGDAELGLPGDNSPAVSAAFEELKPYFDAVHAAAADLIAGRGDPADRRGAILAAEREYLPRMDRIVNLYEEESRARVAALRQTGWGLTALALVTLAAIGLFVLRPAGRTIAGQIGALRDARDRLEDRVEDRTRELERANEALHREHRDRLEAEEKQRELLHESARVGRAQSVGQTASGLAHELNQPLGAVANYVEGCLLRLESEGGVELGELATALGKARDAALRAGAIVARIRRLAERGTTEFVPLDPVEVLDEVAEFMGEEARRRGVCLEVRLDATLPADSGDGTARDLFRVSGDRVQLQQVLTNFLTNAFDAVDAAAPPRPRVSLGLCVPNDGSVELFVEDNGDGLPAEAADRVFDAFYSGRAHGTGIGLAIARSIAEAHGGTLAVRSEPGAGARFSLSLPVVDGPG
ncbi:ATP-binding protein [Alienimonas chondri]|uniref:histidine kinase n=1 Tax=Alienimonas chondri TaxID=2681879 RepID=A0ABX1VEV7_9PLAN|nr:ATP-binding protein [Alienimonas chondri]NNJ26620.1 Adaptive-response sensory-kinase SasA [Alienimonas chondri]